MKRVALSLPLAGLLSLAGCASQTGLTDATFGESVRQARAVQMVDPGASARQRTLSGIDAQAARSSMDRYQESFRNPPSTFGVMGIGGGVSAGAQ